MRSLQACLVPEHEVAGALSGRSSDDKGRILILSSSTTSSLGSVKKPKGQAKVPAKKASGKAEGAFASKPGKAKWAKGAPQTGAPTEIGPKKPPVVTIPPLPLPLLLPNGVPGSPKAEPPRELVKELAAKVHGFVLGESKLGLDQIAAAVVEGVKSNWSGTATIPDEHIEFEVKRRLSTFLNASAKKPPEPEATREWVAKQLDQVNGAIAAYKKDPGPFPLV